MCVIIKKIKKGVKTHMEFPEKVYFIDDGLHGGGFWFPLIAFFICATKCALCYFAGEFYIFWFMGAFITSGFVIFSKIGRLTIYYFFAGPRHQSKKFNSSETSCVSQEFTTWLQLHDIKNELSRMNNRNHYR